VTGSAPRFSISWNYPDYVALRDRNQSFTGLAGVSIGMSPLGIQPAEADAGIPTGIANTLMVSGNYFQVLGVPPEIGRLFSSEEDRAPGAAPYAVLSYDYWQSRYQGDP